MQAVQVTLALNQTGAAGAQLLGQTQAAATNGVAMMQKATLRARPGEYQLVVTALNAPLVCTRGGCRSPRCCVAYYAILAWPHSTTVTPGHCSSTTRWDPRGALVGPISRRVYSIA
jgi:hypothetical protein